jgi:acetyl-CoA carboxylase biotin carboxyl carrier protein
MEDAMAQHAPYGLTRPRTTHELAHSRGIHEISGDIGAEDADSLPEASRSCGADMQAVLRAASETALELLASSVDRPRSLRVQVGAVAIELEWPDGAGGDLNGPPPFAPGGQSEFARPRGALPGPVDDPLSDANLHHVLAETVGVFFVAAEPGAVPFVQVGDSVRVGQQIGIIEVMKMMVPVKSDCAGRLVDLLKENGAPVDFGEPILTIARA